jgi:threonine dehydrogenase-like Zn-dependent dehydrogenase
VKAVIFDRSLACRDIPVPENGGWVTLAVKKAGICGTDLAIASGDLYAKTPLVLGHEIFGTIWRAPEGRKNLLGKRAVTEINVACGGCAYCRMGLNTHCEKVEALGIDRDGGFAEYVSTPVENVHLVPDSIADEEAVFVEPLAASIQLTKMSPPVPGSTWAVIGTGRMGLLILQVLMQHSPSVLVAIGHEGMKLEKARRLGAKVFIAEEAAKTLELTGGVKFDNVVEASGSPGGLSLALELVRPRGTIHLKSTHGLPVQLDVTKVTVDELRIQGSRCGPFDEAMALIERKDVRVKEMVTHRFHLEECGRAFEAAGSKEAIKVVFEV